MKEIHANEWKEFFDAFSREHQGWIVSAEVLSQELGAQPETKNLPFEGAFAELKSNGNQIVVLMYGDTPASHITHTITSPTHIRVDGSDNHKLLQIESAENTTLILTFQPAKTAEQASR